MGYVRNDGKYIIYIIKHLYKDNKERDWDESGSCEQFYLKHISSKNKRLKEIFSPFTASGNCWQTTGIHGSYVKKEAIKILDKISEWNPQNRFKVCRLLINQVTEDVVEKKYARIA